MQNKRHRLPGLLVLATALLLAAAPASAQLAAFPGAMGFGAEATGGRGGTVYHVTTLADSGPGSFRDAVSASNRIVVFDVSGYIQLETAVSVKSNITIAGETAPGEGIGFRGGEISFANSTNIICRYIRIRPGSETASEKDDALSFYRSTNVIVDHCSIEFAPWNNIDGVSDDWQNHPVNRITVQNSIIADPTGQQFGAHTEAVEGTWSWFNNIFANSHNRNPLAKINTIFINNVLYNCSAGYTTHTSTPFQHDIINNFFILGPASGGSPDNSWFQIDEHQSIYYDGNLKDSTLDGLLKGGTTIPFWYDGQGTILTAPWSAITPTIPAKDPHLAYYYNVSRSGTFPHDELDRFILGQVKTLGQGTVGTGAGTAGPDGGLYHSQAETGLANNGYGSIQAGTPSPDQDQDGMPDYWELATGSNPSVDDAMQTAADGYTLIEHYLHYMAGLHAATAKNTAVSVDVSAYASAFSAISPAYTVQSASGGTVTLGSDGHTATFTPATDFTGLAQFAFTVTGTGGITYTDTVVVAVSAPPAIRAPSELTASAVTRDVATPYSVVTLGWKDNADNETGFALERAGSDGIFTLLTVVEADKTAYEDSASVTPGETYQYRLRAVNGQDTSFYTETASVETPLPPQPPTAAGDPGPADGASLQLAGDATQLSWTAGENTDSFVVLIGTAPESLAAQDSFPATTLSYQASGLQQNATYYWRIDAKNEKGTTPGTVWSFQTTAPTVSGEEGLVGYWSLDDVSGSTVTDSTAYHNNGVIGVNPDDASIHVDGHRNKALDLQSLADNAYGIKIPHQPQLLLDKSSFTISFWVKADPSIMPQDNNTDQYLLCKGSIGTNPDIGSTGKRIDLECKNKTLRFALDAGDSNGGGKDELSADAAPVYTGQWVNVILMRDSAEGKMRIYINGTKAGEKSIGKSAVGTGETSALILGNIGERELESGAATPAPFRGSFDEVKIYNYALSEGQIYQLSEHYPEGLVGYWSFDDKGTTPVVTDSSVYKDDGTLGLDPSDPSIRVPGYRGTGLDFATLNNDSYAVSIPNQGQLFLDQDAFSISFWMKAPTSMFPTSNDMDYYLLCKGSIGTNPDIGSTGKRFDLEFKNKTLRFALDAGDAGSGGKDELSTDATPFFTGDWVNVIVIRDTAEQKMRIYLNAQQVAEKDISKSSPGIGELSALILGNIGERELLSGAATPAPYKGMLDELRIYNYALTYTDIVTLYYGSPVALKAFNPSYNQTTVDGYTDTLKLTWDGGANTTKFQLYMGADSTDMQLVSDSIDVDHREFPLTSVRPDSVYYWRVDAVGILGTTTGDVWSFKTAEPKGMVAHYALDAASGLIATDSSDYHNDGTLSGVPSPVWFGGKYKNALAFGTVTDTSAIVVPAAPQIRFLSSSFSISLWLSLPEYNTTSGKYNCYLLHKGTMENVDAGTGKWYGLQIKDKTLTFAIDDGIHKASAGVSIAPGSKFDLFGKGWVHIVALRDLSIDRIRIYINGVLAKSVNDASVTGTVGQDVDLLIGNSPEHMAFRDSLDDIRIYNYALSEDLIHKQDEGIPLLEKVVNPTPRDDSDGAGPEQVHFSWEDPTGTAVSYRFLLGTSPDSLNLLATGLDTTAFTVDTLMPRQTYYWRVDDSSDVERVVGDVWSFTAGGDTTLPKIVLHGVQVALDASGEASVTAAMADSASSDEYGLDSIWLEKTEFTCPDLGTNRIVFNARDTYGNIATDTATIEVLGDKPPAPVISPADTTICAGDLIQLRASRDSTTDRYLWILDEALNTQKTDDSLLPVNHQNDYRVIAISAQSCPSDTSLAAHVLISADTALEVSGNQRIQRGASVNLSATGDPGDLTWSPDIAISPVTGGEVTVSPRSTTIYTVTLTNPLGCQVSRAVTVDVADGFQASYNRILTPNGDGINDKLVIDHLSGYPNNRLQIYDESGKLIYQQNGYDNSWEGRISGHYVAKGTYYFVLFIDGDVKIKGSFTVIH